MSGLFGKKSQSTTEQRYNAIALTQSAYGQPVPLVYGMTRGAGFLFWYSDFVSTPHSQQQGGKGGGGPTSTTYTYTAALMMGLCEGGATAIAVNNIYAASAVRSLSDLNLTLFTGLGGQAVWAYLTSNHPTQAIPYDHVAYVATASYQLGNNASLPNLSYEIKGLIRYNPGTVEDAEPSAMITDYCTDANHGANFPYLGTLTGANSYQQWCVSMGMFLSYNESTQRAAGDFIKEVLQVTNSAGVIRGNGNLDLVPYCDAAVSGNGGSYTPNMTPLYSFTDDDFCPKSGEDPVLLTRTPYTQTFNVVNVEYEDRANQYNRAIASAYDDNDIALNGTRVMQTASLPAIKTAALAKLVAQLILQRQLYYRNQYRFRLRPDYCALEPMDLVALTDSGIGANNVLCRVTQVVEDTDDGLELTVEEVPIGPATAPAYSWQGIQGYTANHASAPGSVNTPYIFRLPGGLYADGQQRIGIAVNGPNNGLWAGCNVWISFDNVNYEQIGVVTNPARYGTLAAAFATGADPDTTNTLQLTLNNSALTLSGGAQSDADQMRTLLLVDGEIMSYTAATFVSAGRYNLGTYLRRGLYGSTKGAHLISTNWARLDTSIFKLDLDPGLYGQQIWFKFQSFNVFQSALESLASVTAYTYTPSAAIGSGDSNLTTAGFAVVSAYGRIHKAPNGAAATWDSSAWSPQAFTKGVSVSWRAMQTNGDAMTGLSSNPASGPGFAALNFGIQTQSNGALIIYELGSVAVASSGSYTVNDTFEVRYDGVTVKYMQNGTLLREVRAPGLTLYPMTCIYTKGAGIYDFAYGATADGARIGGSWLNNLPWVVGASGNQGLYKDLGVIAGAIILGTGASATSPLGPYNTSEPLWQGAGNAATGTVCGFANGPGQLAPGDIQGIDPAKAYRCSVWFRYDGPTTGTPYIYFGCDTANTRTLPGANDTNPYFAYIPMANLTADKWYLLVGVLHGYGYAAGGGGQTGISGIYDPVTGQKVAGVNGLMGGGAVAGGSDFCMGHAYNAQLIRTFGYNTTAGSTSLLCWWAKPRWDEMNGQEPSLWSLLHPTTTIDPSSGKLLAIGSTPATVPDTAFTYTATTTTVTISWTAITIYRADGTTATVTAGSKTITGLTASTTYWHYAYAVDNGTGTLTCSFATGTAGMVGTTASALPSTATLAQQGVGSAVTYNQANIPLYKVTTVTPAAGTGGGGGGGGGLCLHPGTEIETAERGAVKAGTLRVGEHLHTPSGPRPVVAIRRHAHARWYVVRLWGLSGWQKVNVTGDHRFFDAHGATVRADALKLGQLLEGDKCLLRVVGLTLLESEADVVALELDAPHVYYTQKGGVLSHNFKP